MNERIPSVSSRTPGPLLFDMANRVEPFHPEILKIGAVDADAIRLSEVLNTALRNVPRNERALLCVAANDDDAGRGAVRPSPVGKADDDWDRGAHPRRRQHLVALQMRSNGAPSSKLGVP